jgi:hypothetical protein
VRVCALRNNDADPSLDEAIVKRFGLVETSSLRGHLFPFTLVPLDPYL